MRLWSTNFTDPSGTLAANARAGSQAITNGQATVAVVFSSTLGTTAYALNVLVRNTLDGSPIFLIPTETIKAATGFTVTFNAAADSVNYVLEYTALKDM